MKDRRITLELRARPDPRAVNHPLLYLRSGTFIRPFLPHLSRVWARVMRPAAGGPALVALGEKKKAARGR